MAYWKTSVPSAWESSLPPPQGSARPRWAARCWPPTLGPLAVPRYWRRCPRHPAFPRASPSRETASTWPDQRRSAPPASRPRRCRRTTRRPAPWCPPGAPRGRTLLAEHANSSIALDSKGRIYALNTQLGIYRLTPGTGAQEQYALPFPLLLPCPLAPPGTDCSPTLVETPPLGNDLPFDRLGNSYVPTPCRPPSGACRLRVGYRRCDSRTRGWRRRTSASTASGSTGPAPRST